MRKDGSITITGGKVLSPSGFIANGMVSAREGRIVYVGGPRNAPPIEDSLTVDASGYMILPGFVDVHIHGGGGYDTMDGNYEALCEIAKAHAKYGTTSLLPTTVTASEGELERAVTAVSEAVSKGTGGADILGVHLEGPYINVAHKGAQNAKYVREASKAELLKLCDLSGDNVRLVSLAPEIPGALDAISWLTKKGITSAVGHSGAKYDNVVDAVNHGLSHATHTFNGMTGLHHREPGAAGAVLSLEAITAEVIADLIHVHPAVVRVIVAAKGKDSVVLVTDAIRAMGMPDGEYELGGLPVTVKEGTARLKEGNLAGSTLSMAKAVRNLVKVIGVPVADAVQMATANPAKVAGAANRKGSLTVGKDADLVAVDSDFEVVFTVVRGNVVYRREDE